MAKTINLRGRQGKYWATWADAKKQLSAAGFDDQEIEEERHACHRRALEEDPSSNDIITDSKKLTKVLAEFDAIASPDDLDKQLKHQRDQDPREQLIWSIRQLGLPDSYLNKIATDTWQQSPWSALSQANLIKLRFTARKRATRRAKTSDPF